MLSFLLFLSVLVVAAGVGVWWLGPGVVQLTLDDERRSAPYYALQLTRGGGDEDAARRFAELAQADEGQLLWRGGLERLLDGRTRDEWRQLLIVRFPAGGNLVQMITSPAYRELGDKESQLLLGVAEAPADLTSDAVLLLGLLAPRSAEELPTPAELAALKGNLGEFSGRVVWEASTDLLDGAEPWGQLLTLSFPNAERAMAWFREPATVTERSLAARHFERQSWLLLSAAYLRD